MTKPIWLMQELRWSNMEFSRFLDQWPSNYNVTPSNEIKYRYKRRHVSAYIANIVHQLSTKKMASLTHP